MNILELKRKLLPLSGPQMDGGGGGGGSSPTGTQTQISELPEWARGYAKSALEKGAALSETPYQAYGGNRIAGFSPLQQQSQEAAGNMTTNAGTAAGISGAQDVMGRALGTNYDAGKFTAGQFGNDAAQQYMNPYMQNVVDIQKREATRQAGIQGQQQQAAGVGRGAFGGSRDAMMRAEANRNLNTQMNDIQAIGSSNAYTNAQQQFNADQARNMQAQQLGEQSRQYGAGLGMQGLQTALQGANTMGTLGSQQFQQGMDINKLQNAYGGQQQALRQQGLTQAYQDFQDQKNHPYKQLGFMSDMIRGLPLGQQSTRTMYEPNPSMAQNVAALGAGAYGLSKFMAEGGMAYADGGSVPGYSGENGSVVSSDVDSQDNVAAIVHTLSDQDLQKAMQAAQARGDVDQLEAIQNEMGMRASLKNGLAGAVTPQMAAAGGLMDSYAGGGILAFKEDGLVPSEDSDATYYREDPAGYADPSLRRLFMMRDKALSEFKASPAMTRKERAELEQESFDRRQKFAGEDPYAPMAEKFKTFEADRAKNLEEGKGLAALQAIPAILQGGNAARGLGAGVGALGGNLAQLAKSDAAEKRALAGMDFNLKDAQRKERMGLTKEAMADAIDEQKNRIATDKLRLDALKAGTKSVSDAGRAFRTAGGAGGAGKEPKMNEQLVAAEVAYENNPTPETLGKLKAVRRAVDRAKTSDSGENRTRTADEANAIKRDKLVEDGLKEFMYTPGYQSASPAKKKVLWAEETARLKNEPLPRDGAIDLNGKAKGGIISPIKLD